VTGCAPAVVRAEQPRDRRGVFELNARAFPQPAEAELVDALRSAGALALSLVAESGGRVVGHVAFSPVRVGRGAAAWDALALGPLAVDPDRQRAGIGSALVRAGLERCRQGRHPVVFVLGHPRYYRRFGFVPAAPRGFEYERGSRFAPAFFVVELEPGALAGRAGVVCYRVEFAKV
jgi:putative acetyltransferase